MDEEEFDSGPIETAATVQGGENPPPQAPPRADGTAVSFFFLSLYYKFFQIELLYFQTNAMDKVASGLPIETAPTVQDGDISTPLPQAPPRAAKPPKPKNSVKNPKKGNQRVQVE